MKRLAAVAATVLALCLCAAAGAGAADGSWGPWEPTYQGAITAPAGTVCPFAVSAEPVHEHLLVRYHYDASGAVDGYQATGSLVARITNLDSGASVERNLSGLGTVTLNADGSYDALADGSFLLFMRAGDSPSNELLLLTGRSILHGSATGAKTVVESSGRTEDLCRTLA